METVGSVIARTPISPASVVRRPPESTMAVESKEPDGNVHQETELSNLAKQLSAAAERAAARDASLSREELADFASKILDKLMGDSYLLAKDFFDEFLPDTDDPELLERARQANAFAKGRGENPFKGLSRDQLSLIIYDESGAFTINERRAARVERTEQHNEWARYIIDKMGAEYRQTGRNDQGLHEILDFYNSLPRIEVAQYGNYEADINMQLAMHEVEWPEFNTSLIDMLAHEWKPSEPPVTPEQPDPAADPTGKAPD
ncbi:hypothetical protein [Pseudomonas sp. xss_2]|uniref:hypothetical protein n=1 Tax=Pseudomonas sp. xss_2 TaxID=3367215 RepID=UPI00370DBCCE